MLNYSFAFLSKFKKDYKEAKKKNHQLDEEFSKFIEDFNHLKGDVVVGTSGARKIRMAGAQKGKCGGYRIYYYFEFESKIYLLRFFAKNIQEDLSIKEKIEITEIIQAIKSR
jgi:mRNA-degrading endonuclease RelE of RelBE toxin-antitoxin system